MKIFPFGSPRKCCLPFILSASAAAFVAVTQASAATFTYTPVNSGTDLWSLGSAANWSGTPVSAADTRLTFTGSNATVLADGLTTTNTNDIAGQFQLNILDLQGTGPTSGAATININSISPSAGLNFVSNGATTPIINLNALAGSAGLTYNVNQPVTLGSNTLFTGAGTAAFNFNNGIEGSAVTLTKSGASALTLGGGTSLGSLNLGLNSAGGKITVGANGTLTIGSGSGNVSVGASNTSTAASGTLDVSAASSFIANVATFAIGSTGNNGVTAQGSLNLSISNDITATTSFVIGGSGGARNGVLSSVTTVDNSFTTIRTPSMSIGGTKSIGQFTLATGSTLQITGVTGRAALAVGNSVLGGGGGDYSGTADFSNGILNATLSSLVIGNRPLTDSTLNETGTMTLSNSEFNHLDISGPSAALGGVVAIGRATGATSGSSTGGSVSGTLTIGNLDSTSQIISTDNGTGILIGAKGGTEARPIPATGILHLNGGTLKITTTGSAIAGGTGTSTVNFNGTTLIAGASSANWITNLTTANIASGGAIFDTGGFSVTVGQSFSGSGKLTKIGLGQLTVNGTNTFTGGVNVQSGLLFLPKTEVLPNFAAPGQLTIAESGSLGLNVGGPGEFTIQQLNDLRATNGVFLGANHNLAIGTANAGGDIVYTSSFNTIGNFAKLGVNKLTLDNNPTIVGGLDIGLDNMGGTLIADSGSAFSIGSGPADSINIGVTRSSSNASGVLDASAATSLTINVGTISMGTTSGDGLPDSAMLTPANSNITAESQFVIGDSTNANPGARTNTVTTGAGGLTNIKTANLTIGGNKSNGSFTLGVGGALNLAGVAEGGRAALNIGNYNTTQGGTGNYTGNADFSAGIFSATLNSLVIGHLNNLNGSGSETGILTLSANPANHLDISGTGIGPVVVIGRHVASNGTVTGTLTIGNLDSTSSITSAADETAILIGTGGTLEGGGKATGTLNLNGGTLTITTTGTAIGGDTVNTANTSTVHFNGTTLRAGASSTNWISGLTNANVSVGGAKFDTNGNEITIPQSLIHDPTLQGADGGLTKLGSGVLTLTGANTYTGGTTVSAGTLVVSGSLNGTSAVAVTGLGSKLQLGASNVINDAANLNLDSGTLEALGFSETLGALTLAGTATIDFGSGLSILQFASSGTATWTGTLSITNWSGSLTGGGSDRLFFGDKSGGLTSAQLALINFVDPEGFTPGVYDAQILPTGEIVAVVPEPGTAALMFAGAALLGIRRRRQLA